MFTNLAVSFCLFQQIISAILFIAVDKMCKWEMSRCIQKKFFWAREIIVVTSIFSQWSCLQVRPQCRHVALAVHCSSISRQCRRFHVDRAVDSYLALPSRDINVHLACQQRIKQGILGIINLEQSGMLSIPCHE